MAKHQQDVRSLTLDYERWLSAQRRLIGADLRAKRKLIRTSAFVFLRGTFYLWAWRWPKLCPSLNDAPLLSCIGDLHIENFGTWRDAEGRLIWGINDFDEAARMPYTIDLVRLATSAALSADEKHLSLGADRISEAILDGYRRGLEEGGEPVVIAERKRWLATTIRRHFKDRAPQEFWDKLLERLQRSRKKRGKPDAEISRLAMDALPAPNELLQLAWRRAGVGSLGRPRVAALAAYGGGYVAREVKARYASAWRWARNQAPTSASDAAVTLLTHAIRSPDPTLQMTEEWVIRRLAPDCNKIDLDSLPAVAAQCRLLSLMGHETANVHLANTRAAADARKHLARQPAGWLERAVRVMYRATRDDWREWRRCSE